MGPKGQVVIPKAIRDHLHLRPGDSLLVREEGDEAHIRRATLEVSERRAIAQRMLGALADGKVDPVAGLEAEHHREVEAGERDEVGVEVVDLRVGSRP
jgi:AbrB family looped-hinge helix DNA binding protein